MNDTLRAVLDAKGHSVHAVDPKATVLDAVRTMNAERIGALLVMDDEELVGIFTERDVLCRIVDQGRDPAETRIAEVMTRRPVVVKAGATVEEAMAVVTEKRCRHLPVVDEDGLVGLVSSGDLTHWVTRNQEFHIQDLVNFITSRYPG
jgi:CBS domain-containing protein